MTKKSQTYSMYGAKLWPHLSEKTFKPLQNEGHDYIVRRHPRTSSMMRPDRAPTANRKALGFLDLRTIPGYAKCSGRILHHSRRQDSASNRHTLGHLGVLPGILNRMNSNSMEDQIGPGRFQKTNLPVQVPQMLVAGNQLVQDDRILPTREDR